MRYENEAMTSASIGRNPSAYDEDATPSLSLADESANAASMTESLHGMLDDLELRLFGPAPPRAVGTEISAGNQSNARPALAYSVRTTRQRLDNAAERLSRILARL